jgi:hypothetical protein
MYFPSIQRERSGEVETSCILLPQLLCSPSFNSSSPLHYPSSSRPYEIWGTVSPPLTVTICDQATPFPQLHSTPILTSTTKNYNSLVSYDRDLTPIPADQITVDSHAPKQRPQSSTNAMSSLQLSMTHIWASPSERGTSPILVVVVDPAKSAAAGVGCDRMLRS